MLYNPGEVLVINPKLAAKIGLNEAIILQQLHYWLEMPGVGEFDSDGHKWIYNTYEQWHENFPFYSVITIKRTFLKLEKEGFIIAKHKAHHGKRTKYYRINYEALRRLEEEDTITPQGIDENEPQSNYEELPLPSTPEELNESDVTCHDDTLLSHQTDTLSSCQIDTVETYQPDTFLINKDYGPKDYGLTKTTKARYRAREPGGEILRGLNENQEMQTFREKRVKRSEAQRCAAANCAVIEEPSPQDSPDCRDFRWLRKQYHELARSFLDAAGEIYYPRTASERKLWYKTLHEWYLIEARGEEVRQAVLKLRKDGLTIGGIQSVTKTLRAVKASAYYDPLEALGYQRL